MNISKMLKLKWVPRSDQRIKKLTMEMFRPRSVGKRVRKYLAPVFLLAAASASTFCQSSTIVSGRAVNDGGRPIPNALVTLYTAPEPEAFELILPGAHTLSGGEFFIDSGRIESSMVFQLFIEEPPPKGFWSPFSGPPFGKLSRPSPFRGTTIQLKPNQTRANLGDVKAGIQFAKVVIDLTRAWNTEARPSPEELRQGKLRIRDGAGNIVYDGRMPESALAFYKRGKDFQAKGDNESDNDYDYLLAIKDYTEAIRLNSKSLNAYFKRGALYLAQQKYDEAPSVFDLRVWSVEVRGSLAKHFMYFVTVRNEETVLYRMIAEPGEDIVCTQGSD
jgi:hypothetical protein